MNKWPFNDNELDEFALANELEKAERLGMTKAKEKPVQTGMYIPGLMSSGKQWNARAVLGEDDFANPYEALRQERPDNSGRIAEITKRLEEIREAKKNYSVEEEMGKYKFLFDADPSTLANYKQSLRNAEAAEKIRQKNEKSTEAYSLKSLFENSADKNDTLRADLMSAQQRFEQAKRENNADGMERALLDIKRVQSALNSNTRKHEQLRKKLAESLGVDMSDNEEVADTTDYSAYGNDITAAKGVSEMKGSIERLGNSIKTDNVAISKRDKALKAKQWLEQIGEQRQAVENSPLSDDAKQALYTDLDKMEEAVRNYKKPASKSGQAETETIDDIKAKVYRPDGTLKNAAQLESFGSVKLQEWKKKYPALNIPQETIDALIRKGK